MAHTEELFADPSFRLITQHPIGRFGEAQEVAELVPLFSANQTSFVTGACYPVDGGYQAR